MSGDSVLGVRPNAKMDTGLQFSTIFAERAVNLDPRDGRSLHELAMSFASSGDLSSARAVIERAVVAESLLAPAWLARGRLLAAEAERRGGMTADEFSAHAAYLRRALGLAPDDVAAKYHLIRVAIRGRDWSTAFEAAAQDSIEGTIIAQASSSADPAELWSLIRNDPSIDANFADVWLVAHWQRLSMGDTSSAFAAKDIHARCVATIHARDGFARTVQAARALHQLREFESVESLLRVSYRNRRNRHQAEVLQRLLDDHFVRQGELNRLKRRPVPLALRDTEARFHSMIRGRRIAVVGPKATVDRAEEIAIAEVIAFPLSGGLRIPRSSHAHQVRIAYVANSVAFSHANELAALLDTHQIDLLVLRPSLAGKLPPALRRKEVRLCPAETSILLEATPFAITRIVEDILAADPASIGLYQSDLFTSTDRYDPGYRRDPTTETQIVENLDGYGHDLRADHRWLKRLHVDGAINPAPELSAVLRLDEVEYLAKVAEATRQRLSRE